MQLPGCSSPHPLWLDSGGSDEAQWVDPSGLDNPLAPDGTLDARPLAHSDSALDGLIPTRPSSSSIVVDIK